METTTSKTVRVFRSQESILHILDEYNKSKLSIKAFCIAKGIASATFHNSNKRYSKRTVKSAKVTGFTALEITKGPAVSEKYFYQTSKVYLAEGLR